MDALVQAGQYAQGQGADQVAMMNSMGLAKKTLLISLRVWLDRGLGANAITGAGSFILDQ